MADGTYCEKCKRFFDDIITKEGDNEVVFDGDVIRMALWLAKPINQMTDEDIPVGLEVGRTSIHMSLNEFKELCNAVLEMKKIIEKRMQLT